MSRKKVIIFAIVVATVIMAGGGGVYAAYNYHQLKQEEEKRLKEQEEKRLEDARAEIARELESLDVQVVALYSDNQKKMLVDGIDQDAIDLVLAKIESFKEVYKENKDISQEQNGKLQELEEDVKMANTMNKVVTKYNSLYPNGQLTVPKIETDEIVTTVKEVLKELELVKPDFFKIYSEKLNETESGLAYQKSVVDAVNMIYNREIGNMVEGVTRKQYADVMTAVDSLSENELKVELKSYLTIVDQELTVQEEAAQAAQAKSKSNIASNASSSGSNFDSSNKGNGSSGNSGGSSKGSSGSGSSGGNSGGASSLGSGNDSSGSNSGSSNKGSGNNSSGGSSSNGSSGGDVSEDDGYGTWESETIGGGDIKGGGTYEWGTW